MVNEIVCVVCGSKYVVNRKYKLCQEHNYQRLHGGQTKQQVYKDKEKTRPDTEEVKKLKSQYSIKKITNKRAIREQELTKVYKEIDSEREPICEGCGRGDRPLSHSHLLSRANRPDLLCDKRNIRLHCYMVHGNCHQKWENFVPDEVTQMNDFWDNLEYIAQVDPKIFQKMTAKLESNL